MILVILNTLDYNYVYASKYIYIHVYSAQT